MAGSDGLTWGVSSATVNVGETITVSIASGMAPTASGITGAFNGLATAAVGGSEVEITGVSAGTVTVPAGTDVGNMVSTVNTFALTVVDAEDESYLNKRGLTHFWENIDDIKQNKLTAGAGISITNDVISATGDSTLSPTSTNPIQNQAVYNAIGDVESILTTLNIGGGAQ